jgi:hypothetical protein
MQRRNSDPPRLAVAFKSPSELTNAALARIIDAGKRQGELLEELREAVRTGDRELAWAICQALNADWEKPLAAA